MLCYNIRTMRTKSCGQSRLTKEVPRLSRPTSHKSGLEEKPSKTKPPGKYKDVYGDNIKMIMELGLG